MLEPPPICFWSFCALAVIMKRPKAAAGNGSINHSWDVIEEPIKPIGSDCPLSFLMITFYPSASPIIGKRFKAQAWPLANDPKPACEWWYEERSLRIGKEGRKMHSAHGQGPSIMQLPSGWFIWPQWIIRMTEIWPMGGIAVKEFRWKPNKEEKVFFPTWHCST